MEEFLAQQWDLIVDDFFTIQVWTAKGPQRLSFCSLSSCPPDGGEISGISAAANGLWMSQTARNLTDSVDEIPTSSE